MIVIQCCVFSERIFAAETHLQGCGSLIYHVLQSLYLICYIFALTLNQEFNFGLIYDHADTLDLLNQVLTAIVELGTTF